MRYTEDAAWLALRALFIDLAPYRSAENHRKRQRIRDLKSIPENVFGAPRGAPALSVIDRRLSPNPCGEAVFFGVPLSLPLLHRPTNEPRVLPRPRALSAGC